MAKRKTNNQNKEMELIKRIALLIIGMGGLIILFIYSFDLSQSEIFVNIFGYNITTYFFAGLLIILGILFSTILKSGLLGKWRLD